VIVLRFSSGTVRRLTGPACKNSLGGQARPRLGAKVLASLGVSRVASVRLARLGSEHGSRLGPSPEPHPLSGHSHYEGDIRSSLLVDYPTDNVHKGATLKNYSLNISRWTSSVLFLFPKQLASLFKITNYM